MIAPHPNETPERIVTVRLTKPVLSADQQYTRTFLMTGENARVAGQLAAKIGGETGATMWENVRVMLENADSAWEAFVSGYNHPQDHVLVTTPDDKYPHLAYGSCSCTKWRTEAALTPLMLDLTFGRHVGR